MNEDESTLTIKIEDVFKDGVVGYYNFYELEKKILEKILDYLYIHREGIQSMATSEKIIDLFKQSVGLTNDISPITHIMGARWCGIDMYRISEKGNELRLIYKKNIRAKVETT